MKVNAIILAGGMGVRMKSNLPKVIHPLLGKPIINYVIDTLNQVDINRIIIVIGYKYELVKKTINHPVEFIIQKEILGTGSAVLAVKPLLKNDEGITIILSGDTPLVSAKTLRKMITFHQKNKANATVLTSFLENAYGYGRIKKDNNNIIKIIEEKDATNEEKKIKEINTGIYCFNNKLLFKYINQITNNNAKLEYYLTDIIEIIQKKEGHVYSYNTADKDEIKGINNRKDLVLATKILKQKINYKLIDNGITIIDPDNTYISFDTTIGKDSIIYPGSIIFGKNKIGESCIIGPNTYLENVNIGNNTTVKYSFITNSKIKNKTTIGPFTHLRNNNIIEEEVKIGSFVEIKNTTIKNNTKIPHLSYLGDAKIGKNTNIGCGSITVNYDGNKKYKTIIGNNSFIGCNTNLIAPIKIGDYTYIAAGSTINKDVPNESFAIARNRQTNKEKYALKYLKKE